VVPSCTRLDGVLLSTSFSRAILPVFVTSPIVRSSVSAVSTAGDQPQAIARLIEGIEDGAAYQTCWGDRLGQDLHHGQCHCSAGAAALIMAPTRRCGAAVFEMREFFPENAIEYFVSYYDYYQPEAYVPARDLFIEKDSSINEHIEQMRLSATKSLLERRDTVIVATVSAIYGIGDPSDYHSMILLLRENEKMSQREVITRLTQMQYDRNDIEFKRGCSACAATSSTSSRRNTRRPRSALSCSTTWWKRCTCSTRSPGRSSPRWRASPCSRPVITSRRARRPCVAIEQIKVELRERLEWYYANGKLVERSGWSSAPASTSR